MALCAMTVLYMCLCQQRSKHYSLQKMSKLVTLTNEFMHICAHACMHAYTHTHMHTHAHTCMHMHTHTQTHMPARTRTHTHKVHSEM